ncbi:unnamed protein product [Gadus morhua 'NCC']
MMVMGGLFKGASCSHHNRSFTYHRGGGGEEEEGDKEVKKEEEAVELVVEEEEGEEGGDDDHGRPLQKCLNTSTLRMTWEAKVQLEDILTISGFPEEGLMSRVLNAEGADNGLDVVVSLLTFGLLPQRVLLHGEVGDPDPGMSRRPHPQDLRRLSFSSQDMTFPSPCFDFGEKADRQIG